jgi:hypothetical protein
MKYFIYSILILSLISCSKDTDDDNATLTPSYNIWSGPIIEFIKEAGSDPELEVNQDEITSNVSITRGNSGGEIYNILLESKSTKGSSPLGTEWSIGEVSNISNLTFSSFRTAVGSPKEVVGKSLVLHIIEKNIYLYVKFKTCGNNQSGNFSYERSTEN